MRRRAQSQKGHTGDAVSRYFGLVDYKIREAEYFLLTMKDAGEKLNFLGVQYCASAFVSAARSVTFAMQSSLKGIPVFELWYAEKQKKLRGDALAKFFHDFRTVTQHIGENLVGGGSFDKDGAKYHFVSCPDLPTVPDDDVITACENYFRSVLLLVYECYIDLGPIVDGQQHFTENHFASLAKTVEDAEEELGFQRGYTDTGDPRAMPWRWEMLRRSADGCQIEDQFDRWLGKTLPRPDPLPPFSVLVNPTQ